MVPSVVCDLQWPLASGAQGWHSPASLGVAPGTNFCPVSYPTPPSKSRKSTSCHRASWKHQNEREQLRQLPAFTGPQPSIQSRRGYGQSTCACSPSETSEPLETSTDTPLAQRAPSSGTTLISKTVRMTKQMAIASGSSGGLLQKNGQSEEMSPALKQVLEFPLPTFEDVSLAMYRTRNRKPSVPATLLSGISLRC